MSNVGCPICTKQFPLTEIDKHVNECCDSISNPAPIENKTFPAFKSTMTPAEKPVILEKNALQNRMIQGRKKTNILITLNVRNFKKKKMPN